MCFKCCAHSGFASTAEASCIICSHGDCHFPCYYCRTRKSDTRMNNKTLFYVLFLGLLASLFMSSCEASLPVLSEKQAAKYRDLMSQDRKMQEELKELEVFGPIEYTTTSCPCSCTAGEDKEGYYLNFGMFDACYDSKYSIFLVNTQARVSCSGSTGLSRCPPAE